MHLVSSVSAGAWKLLGNVIANVLKNKYKFKLNQNIGFLEWFHSIHLTKQYAETTTNILEKYSQFMLMSVVSIEQECKDWNEVHESYWESESKYH